MTIVSGNPAKVKLVSPFYNSVILSLSSPLKKSIIYHLILLDSILDCSGNSSEIGISASFAIPSFAEAGDIIINEILTNPKDNAAQFVELYNRSQKVIDLKDLLLCSMDTVSNILISQKTISTEGYLIFPGEYFVLTTDPLKVRHQYYTTNPKAFIQLVSFPQFNIDDGIVVISDKPGTIIDKLVYSADMQFPLLNDTKGVSLERINFEVKTQDKSTGIQPLSLLVLPPRLIEIPSSQTLIFLIMLSLWLLKYSHLTMMEEMIILS